MTAISNATNLSSKINELLSRMNLAEKIGQMTQVEKNSLTADDVSAYFIGSVLSGGGGNPTPNTLEGWQKMIGGFQEAALQTRLGIPILYAVDAVHGHNNMVGATIFPHNIGLGAANDSDLVQRIARATAIELAAVGVHWNFAPALSVPQDIRWGRTYEGFSENPEIVARLGRAYLRGLQTMPGADLDHPHAVLGSLKHFVGDGGAVWGSAPRFGLGLMPDIWNEPDRLIGGDQGVTGIDEATLRAIHLAPYLPSLEAGAENIMVSYSTWGGLKMHANQYLLTTVLKEELNFAGFLVSDWKAIDQITPDFYDSVVEAINAGMDMIMVPFEFKTFMHTLTTAVEKGDVPIARIDDAVRRILRVKMLCGLWEHPFGDPALSGQVGETAHRNLAREAVRKSAVLLKNEDALPVSKTAGRILLAGEGADDIGLQCGGWTIEWMGKPGPITRGTTLFDALQKAGYSQVEYSPQAELANNEMYEWGICVLAEPPYAEGVGDRADLHLTADDLALLSRVRACCKKLIVILFSGRPLLINEALPMADAWIAAWLPGTEAAGLVDVLSGDFQFSGRLSYNWPRSMDQVPATALSAGGESPLFPLGFGLSD